MSTLIMDLPIKPFSLNHSKRPVRLPGGAMRMVNTGDHKEKVRDLENNFLRYNRQLKTMGQDFNPKDHFWRIKYFWIYREDEFWTKAGTMSQNTIDLDNGVKGFQDALFKIIGMNDAGCAHIEVMKLPGKETKCVIHLSKHPWAELL
jgi:hypothetical protein